MREIINDIRTIARIVLFSIFNACILVLGFVIRRDDRILLFGSWMGSRFADNSRFLFQYLNANKTINNIKRVIWVARDPEVIAEISSLGYEVYRIGTIKSLFWHLKSGIHIICNMSAKSGTHQPDIDVKLSAGAKKIQLWHGVGIKAVGASANSSHNKTSRRSRWVLKIANTELARRIGSLGGWAEPKILCTSELNIQINIGNSRIHRHNAFVSGYPRYCDCLLHTKDEIGVLERINAFPLTVLYLPTFRDKGTEYAYPLDSDAMYSFIKKNDILWIEKPHQAAEKMQHVNRNSNNVIYLDSKFDVNVLLKKADFIISDYSSAAFDAIYLQKPVIMHVPDINDYEKGGNGLLFNMREYCSSLLTFSVDELIQSIQDVMDNTYYSQDRKEILSRMRKDFFGDNDHSYDSIWNDIKKAIGK